METREYSEEEFFDIMEGKQIKKFSFAIQLDPEDIQFEDSALITLSLPRGLWKVLYASSKAAGSEISEMASSLVCDSLWKILEPAIKSQL